MERSSSSDRIEELLAQRVWVRRVARALVLDQSRADDLEQEAWISALRGGAPRSPRAWLGTVLRRAASHMRRAEGRRATHEAAAASPAPLPSPEEMVERAEVIERVSRAVRGLEEPYRTTVLLRYFEDITPAVIGQRLGVPVETVRTRLRRALAILRERLDEEAGGDRRRWAVLLLPFARPSVPGAPQAVAGGSALAAAAGVLAMTAKAKIAAVAAVLLILGGAAWQFSAGTGDRVPLTNLAPGASSPAPSPRTAAAEDLRSPAPPTEEAAGRAGAQGLLLEGEVVNRTDAPVPGATVHIAWVDAAQALRPETVVTDSVGGFRFALFGTEAQVYADAQGYAASDLHRVEGNPGDTRRLRLELRGPAGTVAGRVLDPAGNPLSGVSIRVGPPEGLGQPGDPLRPRREPAVTDALGRFSVGGVVPGATEVLAQAYRLAPWWNRVEVRARETTEIEIRLQEGAVFYGMVRDVAGSPVGGVRVSVAGMRGEIGLKKVTDGEGRFQFEGLAVGLTTVHADGGDRGSASTEIPLLAGVECRWDATLGLGTTLAGRLVDRKGAPMAGWWVTAIRAPLGFGPSGKARTGEDGRFEIQFLEPRTYEVTFRSEESGVPSVVIETVPGAPSRDVVVPEGAVPSAFLVGTVVDAAGKPVPDAYLTARSGAHARTAVFEKSSGGFQVGPLPAGRYRLELWSESLGPRVLATREVAPAQRLDLGTLQVGPPGTAVLLFQRAAGGPTGELARFHLRRRGSDGKWEDGAQGPAEGRRTLVLEPGTYGVVVRGHETGFTVSPSFEVREGEEVRVEIPVQREKQRWIRITGPREELEASMVRLIIRDRDGETVALGYWGAPGLRAPAIVACATLSPGEYEAETLTDRGAAQRFDLTVKAEDGLRMDAPIEIRLR